MQHLLEWIAQHGATTILLDATPVGVPLYTKFGFIPNDTASAYVQKHAHTLVGLSKTTSACRGPGELSEVIKYDEDKLGVRRTRILTSYYQDYPERIFIARSSQKVITGYIVAQPHRLGPWAADTPEVAKSLLQHALHLSFVQPPSPATTRRLRSFSHEPDFCQRAIGNRCIEALFLISAVASGFMDMRIFIVAKTQIMVSKGGPHTYQLFCYRMSLPYLKPCSYAHL